MTCLKPNIYDLLLEYMKSKLLFVMTSDEKMHKLLMVCKSIFQIVEISL